MADPEGSGLWIDNGRGYCNFHRGQYLLPVDQKEQERLDIMHTMIQAARPKPLRLHHAPFNPQPDPISGRRHGRVLDIGSGTAIWLLDMAEKYADTEFYGLDMANMAPDGLYHNIDIRPVDYESPWALGEGSFDFIHLQMGLGSVGNWPLLYEKIYRHLKPGGWFEHVEVDFTPQCDPQDATLPQDGILRKWWHTYVAPPYAVVGRPIVYDPTTGDLLRQTGFLPAKHVEYRLPLNGWSSDQAEHVSGTWWEYAMSYGEGRGHGLEALSLAVLTRVQGWPADHARRLCEDALRQATNPTVHAYNKLHIWWAQKPPDAPT